MRNVIVGNEHEQAVVLSVPEHESIMSQIKSLEDSLEQVCNYRREIIDRVVAGEHLEFVSHDQVDAAFDWVGEARANNAIHIFDWVVNEFGFSRCDVCGGEKPSMEWGEGAIICSKCNGQGWVKK